MNYARKVHWGIPVVDLGALPGLRLQRILLTAFFGGVWTAWCRDSTWWKRALLVHEINDLPRVDCRACLGELRRRGILTAPDPPLPLFHR